MRMGHFCFSSLFRRKKILFITTEQLMFTICDKIYINCQKREIINGAISAAHTGKGLRIKKFMWEAAAVLHRTQRILL